jgi:hypothetical protein
MRIVSLGVVVGVLATSLMGCRDSAAPSSPERIEVTRLDAPSTVAPGASVDAVLTVGIGCGLRFDHITEVRSGSEITLTAWGKRLTLPPNTFCIDIRVEEPHTYRLEPPFPSKFTIVVPPIESGTSLTQEVQVQ